MQGKTWNITYLQKQHTDTELKKALDDSSTINKIFIVLKFFQMINNMQEKTINTETKNKSN